MYLYSTINRGLVQRLDKLCDTDIISYPLKDKVADLNDALDWYFSVAFDADGQWKFDDINQTSPPIDTQNIVSGTNRYKFSSFTEKILNLIKLEVLDSDGNGLILIPETLEDLSGSFEELYLDSGNTGTPTHYIKYGDFIYLRPFPDYSETNGLKAYFNRPASKFEFVSCVAEADDDTITAVAHGLSAGDTVIFETDGTIPTGITADTQYYVISSGLTADVFKVSATLGGSAINITADGTGNHFIKTSKEPGIPEIHHQFLPHKAALNQSFYSTIMNPKLNVITGLLAQDELEIRKFFANRTKDMSHRLTPRYQDNR